MSSDLVSWHDLSEHSWDTLLLGNGASIAIYDKFTYESLLKCASSNGLSADLESLFETLQTKDFELALRILGHAEIVNSSLGVNAPRIGAAHRELRGSLIHAVRRTHPDWNQVGDALDRAWRFAQQFKTVFSLNYDLLFYWALMRANSSVGTSWFKDCFENCSFQEDWDYLRTPRSPLKGATLVFYPHGMLALCVDTDGSERKISRSGNQLLDNILQEWKTNSVSPLFVAEGTSKQKRAAIQRSPYLKNVFEAALKQVGDIVSYGFSFGEQDVHLLDALSGPKLKRLAVSIHRPSTRDVSAEKARIRDLLGQHLVKASALKIEFFDAESSGVWINR
jgi:hypothetical protein